MALPYLSVEQVEVIRRLKNTGATLQQISEAYDIFDKLDRELGSFGVSQSSSVGVLQPSSGQKKPSSSLNSQSSLEQTIQKTTEANYNNVMSTLQSHPGSDILNNTNIYSHHNSVHPLTHGKSKMKKLPKGVLKEASWCFLFSISKEVLVELMNRCSVSLPKFDPGDLTKFYGITTEDLNRFMSGDLCSIEGENQTVIADWFINELHSTDWFIDEVTEYSESFVSQEYQNTPEELQFTPRRERFTFRNIHLEVLESNFKMNHYPSPSLRQKIAHECNIKMAMSCGQVLLEKERVTPTNVDYWFRNRRKDLVRKAKLAEQAEVNSQPGLSSQSNPASGFSEQKGSSTTNTLRNGQGIYSLPQTGSDNLLPSRESSLSKNISLLQYMPPSSSMTSFQPSSFSGPADQPFIPSCFSESISDITTEVEAQNNCMNGDTTVKQEPKSEDEDDSYHSGPSASKSQKLNVSFNFAQKSGM